MSTNKIFVEKLEKNINTFWLKKKHLICSYEQQQQKAIFLL